MEMFSNRKWEIHFYIKLECEDMNSINQAHSYIVSIRGTLLIHQLQININFIFTEYIGGNSIDTIRQDFPPI